MVGVLHKAQTLADLGGVLWTMLAVKRDLTTVSEKKATPLWYWLIRVALLHPALMLVAKLDIPAHFCRNLPKAKQTPH